MCTRTVQPVITVDPNSGAASFTGRRPNIDRAEMRWSGLGSPLCIRSYTHPSLWHHSTLLLSPSSLHNIFSFFFWNLLFTWAETWTYICTEHLTLSFLLDFYWFAALKSKLVTVIQSYLLTNCSIKVKSAKYTPVFTDLLPLTLVVPVIPFSELAASKKHNTSRSPAILMEASPRWTLVISSFHATMSLTVSGSLGLRPR